MKLSLALCCGIVYLRIRKFVMENTKNQEGRGYSERVKEILRNQPMSDLTPKDAITGKPASDGEKVSKVGSEVCVK